LSAEERRRQEEERRRRREEEQRKKKRNAVNSKLQQFKDHVDSQIASFGDALKTAELYAERNESGKAYVQRIEGFRKHTHALCTSLKTAPESASMTNLVSLEDRISEAKREIDHSTIELGRSLVTLDTELKRDIEAGIRSGFYLDPGIPAVVVILEPEPEAMPVVDDLLAFLLDDDMGEMHEEVSRLLRAYGEINDQDYAHNYTALKLVPLVKKCGVFRKQKLRYLELLDDYHIWCSMCGRKPSPFQFSKQTITQLEAEIKSLEREYVQAEEQAYIIQVVNEVMSEMGAPLLGYRAGQNMHLYNELFSFEDGTVVNVTYNSEGSVVFEMAGAGEDDHMPDAAEVALLCRHMEYFCSKRFPDFVKRLAERGVHYVERHQYPPEAEYAQIININDYELTGITELVTIEQVLQADKRPSDRRGQKLKEQVMGDG
jgi:hypothetical protein